MRGRRFRINVTQWGYICFENFKLLRVIMSRKLRWNKKPEFVLGKKRNPSYLECDMKYFYRITRGHVETGAIDFEVSNTRYSTAICSSCNVAEGTFIEGTFISCTNSTKSEYLHFIYLCCYCTCIFAIKKFWLLLP